MQNPFSVLSRTKDQDHILKNIALKFSDLWYEIRKLKESRYRSMAVGELEKSFMLIRSHIEHHENIEFNQWSNNGEKRETNEINPN